MDTPEPRAQRAPETVGHSRGHCGPHAPENFCTGSVMSQGYVSTSTGKAIQRRGEGDPVNRRTLRSWRPDTDPKQGVPESDGRGAATGAGKKGGCWHRCWQARLSGNTKTRHPASTRASTPASTHLFFPALVPAPLPALFWNSPVLGSCARSPGSQVGLSK